MRTYTLLIFSLFLAISCRAQEHIYTNYKVNEVNWYIKPLFGLHWSHSTRRGDSRFMDAARFDARNARQGILVEYQFNRFSLETGLTNLPVYTGYRFTTDDNLQVGAGVRVTYWHIPLHLQYTLRQFGKGYFIKGILGSSLNVDKGEDLFSGRWRILQSRLNANGSTSTVETLQETTHRSSFISTTIGVSFGKQITKRLAMDIQANCLLSATNIVEQSNEVRQNTDPTVYQLTSQAGAGYWSLLVGVAYKFKHSKQFKLSRASNK